MNQVNDDCHSNNNNANFFVSVVVVVVVVHVMCVRIFDAIMKLSFIIIVCVLPFAANLIAIANGMPNGMCMCGAGSLGACRGGVAVTHTQMTQNYYLLISIRNADSLAQHSTAQRT